MGFLQLSSAAFAIDSVPGPVPARVLAVIDGDTLVVQARIWIGQAVETKVRLENIDTPELTARCEEARLLAEAARALVQELADHGEVTLHDVHVGKYAGRVLARVVAADGRDFGATLLAAGLARSYDGGARLPWCGR
jgi:endonuclease YncB( thermonuclease family)